MYEKAAHYEQLLASGYYKKARTLSITELSFFSFAQGSKSNFVFMGTLLNNASGGHLSPPKQGWPSRIERGGGRGKVHDYVLVW